MLTRRNSILGLMLGAIAMTGAHAASLPGTGIEVNPMHSSITEEKFQTIVINRALEALGYDVQPIKEVTYPVIFQTIRQSTNPAVIDYMTVNWESNQGPMFEKAGGDDAMYRESYFIDRCAQGYLIDKKTARQHNIQYLNDLEDAKIAKLFDADGDGKADLAGCKPGWGCEGVIEHQLDAFGLRDTISHNQGEYSAIIADTITRYEQGQPVLYYTWTPYWVSGVLVPGKDVTWLQVRGDAHPTGTSTKLPNGNNFGFHMDRMRIVASKHVAEKHPAAAKLFEVAKMNVNDVSAQNLLVSNGQDSLAEITRHADAWIKANQAKFDSWIAEALAAAE